MSGAHSDVATKMAQGLAYKDQGNEAFMKGDHVGALKAYHYATLYLAGLDVNVLQQLGPVPDRARGTREDQKQLSLVRSNVCIVSLTRRWQPAIWPRNAMTGPSRCVTRPWHPIRRMPRPSFAKPRHSVGRAHSTRRATGLMPRAYDPTRTAPTLMQSVHVSLPV